MLPVRQPLTLILLVLVSAYRLEQAVCIAHSAWASALTPTQQVAVLTSNGVTPFTAWIWLYLS